MDKSERHLQQENDQHTKKLIVPHNEAVLPSGSAPAPELFPLRGCGCRNLALPGVYEQASTPFQLLPDLLFAELGAHIVEPASLRLLRRITAWNYCSQERDLCHAMPLGSLPVENSSWVPPLNW